MGIAIYHKQKKCDWIRVLLLREVCPSFVLVTGSSCH